MMASVGDCKAFLCEDSVPIAIDLTSSNRFIPPPLIIPTFSFFPLKLNHTRQHGNANDSGGRIGFFREALFPDLRNLHITVRYCPRDSVCALPSSSFS